MIRFVCNCGHRLEVPEDQAGDSLQCPKCGLLVDVPTLSELQNFTEDGTYRMDAGGPVATDSDRMADLGIIYSATKLDEEGNEIDLRTLPAGRKRPRPSDVHEDDDDQGELELKPAGGGKPAVTERPKYDPETGELIRPLDIRNDPGHPTDPSSIPMAKPAIQYAGVDISRRISPLKIAAELFMPANIVVMCILLAAHLFNGILFVTTAGLFFLIPVLLIYQGLLLSHYGNVIDETGRNEHDDLPRPLRNLEFYDDLWGPFVAMFGGFMIAFVVPLFVLINIAHRTGIPEWMMWLLGGIIGTVLTPAVLLTTNTSGSTLNLRPDRVLKRDQDLRRPLSRRHAAVGRHVADLRGRLGRILLRPAPRVHRRQLAQHRAAGELDDRAADAAGRHLPDALLLLVPRADLPCPPPGVSVGVPALHP